jgi:hypothetical protein
LPVSPASVAVDTVFGCKRKLLCGGTLKEDPLASDELVERGLVEAAAVAVLLLQGR